MTDAARIASLEAEVENLKAEVAWLKGEHTPLGLRRLMAPTQGVPQCSRVVEVLLQRGFVALPQLYIALWGDDEPANPRAQIAGYIHRIRKVLTPLGVTIRSEWGVGYSITDEHRDRLRALIAAHETQVAA